MALGDVDGLRLLRIFLGQFRKSDKVSALEHWMESCDASTMTIWVKLDQVPVSGTTTFYL